LSVTYDVVPEPTALGLLALAPLFARRRRGA
jgi:MYXO-CTERM domain-containing protein